MINLVPMSLLEQEFIKHQQRQFDENPYATTKKYLDTLGIEYIPSKLNVDISYEIAHHIPYANLMLGEIVLNIQDSDGGSIRTETLATMLRYDETDDGAGLVFQLSGTPFLNGPINYSLDLAIKQVSSLARDWNFQRYFLEDPEKSDIVRKLIEDTVWLNITPNVQPTIDEEVSIDESSNDNSVTTSTSDEAQETTQETNTDAENVETTAENPLFIEPTDYTISIDSEEKTAKLHDWDAINNQFVSTATEEHFDMLDLSNEDEYITANLSDNEQFLDPANKMIVDITPFAIDNFDGFIFGNKESTVYLSESKSNYVEFGDGGGIARVIGGDVDHKIQGGDSYDRLIIHGGSGDHTLIGGKSYDSMTIRSGSGNHIFESGDGYDRLLIDYKYTAIRGEGESFSGGSVNFKDFDIEKDYITSSLNDATYYRDGQNLVLINGDDSLTINVNMDASSVSIQNANLISKPEPQPEPEEPKEVIIGGWGMKSFDFSEDEDHIIIANNYIDTLNINGGSGDHDFIGGRWRFTLNINDFSGGNINLIDFYSYAYRGGVGGDVIKTSIEGATYYRNGRELVLMDGDKSLTIDVNTANGYAAIEGATRIANPKTGIKEYIEMRYIKDSVVLTEDEDHALYAYSIPNTISVNEGAGSHLLYGGNFHDTFNINGGSGSHLIYGGNNHNEFNINGGSGSHIVDGGNGNNEFNINGGSGSHIVDAGNGNDTFNINGGSGSHVLNSRNGHDRLNINGGSGDHTYIGRSGASDTLYISDFEGGSVNFVNFDKQKDRIIISFEGATYYRDGESIVLMDGDESLTINVNMDARIVSIENAILTAKKPEPLPEPQPQPKTEESREIIVGRAGMEIFDLSEDEDHTIVYNNHIKTLNINGGSGDHIIPSTHGTHVLNINDFTGGSVDFKNFYRWTYLHPDMIRTTIEGATYYRREEELVLIDGDKRFTIDINMDTSRTGVLGATLIDRPENDVSDYIQIENLNSSFTISEDKDHTVFTYVYNGYYEFDYGDAATITIDEGAGSHTIKADAGDDDIYINGGTGSHTFLSGRDHDEFYVNGGSGNHIFYGQSGDDKFYVNGGSGNHVFLGQSGTDEFHLNAGSGDHVIIDGGFTTHLYINGFTGGSVSIFSLGYHQGYVHVITSIEDATYYKDGDKFIFEDGDNRLVIYNRTEFVWTNEIEIEFATLVEPDAYLDFNSNDVADDGRWNLSQGRDATYNVGSDFKVIWDDGASSYDSLLDFSRAFTRGRFTIDEKNGDLILGFANADKILDAEDSFDADTDGSGDISFQEFIDAIGQSNIEFA